MEAISQELRELDTQLYTAIKQNPKNYTYGTSGFRYKALVMKPITLRVGLFIDYLSRFYYPEALGVVITASHNPSDDNGIKLVNPEGEMLDSKFEKAMDLFVNTEDLEQGLTTMRTAIDSQFPGAKPTHPGLIFLARDTRLSGPELQGYFTKFSTSKFLDFGELATPILYFMVAYYNHHKAQYPDLESLPTVLLDKYFEVINKGFEYNMTRFFKKRRFNISIDCSNGVGSLMVQKFRDTKNKIFELFKPTFIYNTDFVNLNNNCGAEWVHKTGKATAAFLELPEEDGLLNICMALDGDADRFIFYMRQSPDTDDVKIVDGNRICVLYCRVLAHFRNLLNARKEEFEDQASIKKLIDAKIGVVYTAYSNNAFVEYATQDLKLEAGIAKTGVKFVHSRAQEFDIGVYFESNGHGTIIYNHEIPEILKSVISSAKTDEARQVCQDLENFLVNQNSINGDAFGNMLLSLSALEILGIHVEELFTCYTDNLSKISKVTLRDRTMMKSTEDERVLASPADIQPKIQEILAQYPGYIGFVRASGTEDCCRVYVEGKDQAKLDELELKLKSIIKEHPALQ